MGTNPGMRPIEKQRPSARTLAEMADLVRYDDQVYAAAQDRFAALPETDPESETER